MRSRALERRTQETFTPEVVTQLKQIEDDLGGRSQLVAMLALAPLTNDLRFVLGMLGDPQHQSMSLAQICAAGNILPGDLLQHLHSAAILKGRVRAAQKIANGIPAVIEDVMKRAAPYQDACHACSGIGTYVPEPTKDTPNPEPQPCETCKGTGQLLYQPDLDRQKLAIEMAQLLPKSGGINILNANLQGAPGGGRGAGDDALARLQLMTDELLYGDRPQRRHSAHEDEAESPIDTTVEEVPDGTRPE